MHLCPESGVEWMCDKTAMNAFLSPFIALLLYCPKVCSSISSSPGRVFSTLASSTTSSCSWKTRFSVCESILCWQQTWKERHTPRLPYKNVIREKRRTGEEEMMCGDVCDVCGDQRTERETQPKNKSRWEKRVKSLFSFLLFLNLSLFSLGFLHEQFLRVCNNNVLTQSYRVKETRPAMNEWHTMTNLQWEWKTTKRIKYTVRTVQ